MEGLLKEQYALRDQIISHKHQMEEDFAKFLKSQEEITRENNKSLSSIKEVTARTSTNLEYSNVRENDLASRLLLVERQLKGTACMQVDVEEAAANRSRKLGELIDRKVVDVRNDVCCMGRSLQKCEDFICSFEKNLNEILEKKISENIMKAANDYLPNVILSNASKCETEVLNRLRSLMKSVVQQEGETGFQGLVDKAAQKQKTIKIKKNTDGFVILFITCRQLY
eukprot:TRINITY_DN3723_c0_g5_i1.p2 TRINITY_DN3723_c0_g5~~TRINITY_DN3723_c0_g5_i1.p2  ORF type:complete len:226 (+),score=31.22 TRINITY_DN3723_c0_g5_i1:410-1087(+)